MKILVSGSTGFVGSALLPFLRAAGHEVVRLTRAAGGGTAAGEASVSWDPDGGRLEPPAIDGFDAAVHLAGESVAAGRWNAAKKTRIRDSRINGTRLLAESLARASRPPRVLACASAIGFYGHRGDEILNEESAPGSDFLASTCREWEAAAAPASRRGIRVVNLRFGFVLGKTGGGLRRMLPPFRFGLGGPLGDGRQYLSWVSIDDVLAAALHILHNESLRGPVNVVAPNPVTNAGFTRILAASLSRPAFLPMPAFAARLAFGEMADALLLASQRVEPARLLASGYRFRHPDLAPALRDILSRPGP
ncbi:MAG: TIGR01777 family oxidoreductase [Candidatus Polarisedimenticolia bacterium]